MDDEGISDAMALEIGAAWFMKILEEKDQRIECLTAALRGLVDALDEDGDSGIESTEILRLRAILGDS